MGLLLVVLLLLLLMGSVPAWPYSMEWGYAPSGILGFLLVVMLVMLLVGAIPWGWNRRSGAPPL